MTTDLTDQQITEKLVIIDERISHHEREITQLLVDRAKLTHLSSSATRIIRAVCAVCELPEGILMGKRRTKEIAIARQMAMVLIHKRLFWTQERTGKLFNRDHGTVIHATHAVSDRIETDPYVKEQWERINVMLEEAA